MADALALLAREVGVQRACRLLRRALRALARGRGSPSSDPPAAAELVRALAALRDA